MPYIKTKATESSAMDGQRTYSITYMVIWYLVGNLATNAAFASLSSSLTLLIKACEPFIFMGIQSIHNKERPHPLTTLATLIICMGVYAFVLADASYNPFGVAAALLSNFAFAARSMALSGQTSPTDQLHQYGVLSKYGVLTLLPVVLVKMLITQKLPILEPTESAISGVFCAVNDITSVHMMHNVLMATYTTLEIFKNISVVIVNVMYFNTVCHDAVTNTALCLFSLGSVVFVCTSLRSKIIRILSLCFTALCVLLLIANIFDGSILYNKETGSLRYQPTCQYPQTITTAWVYDRPIPADIVNNINDIHCKNRDVHITVYCGSTQCIKAITAINTTQISTVFLQIHTLIEDTPLENWFSRHPLNKILTGSYFEDHLRGAVQLALLWKQGGLYIDPSIAIDTFQFSPYPWIMANDADQAQTRAMLDVSCFPSHHPFIGKLMTKFTADYPKYESDNERCPLQVNWRESQWRLYRTCQFGSESPVMLNRDLGIINYAGDNKDQNSVSQADMCQGDPTTQPSVIQTYSGLQFVPFVDRLFPVNSAQTTRRESNLTSLFCEGWEGDNSSTNSQLISLAEKSQDGVHLESQGFYYQSDRCMLTLSNNLDVSVRIMDYLPLMITHLNHGKRRSGKVYLVGVTSEVNKFMPKEVLGRATSVEQVETQIYKRNVLSHYVEVVNLLEIFSNAKLVITQNKNWALSCVAMGTPVVYITLFQSPGANCSLTNCSVLGDDLSLFHAINTDPAYLNHSMKFAQDFNWENPPPNPDPSHLMRIRATIWNVLRRVPSIYDSARKFGIPPFSLPLTSRPSNDLVFHLIFTTTGRDKIMQYLTKDIASGGFKWSNMRAVESIFYHHPFAQVIVHSNTLSLDTFDVLTESGYDISIQPYNLTQLLQGTPAGNFTGARLEQAKKGQHWYSHETDFLRTLIMYKYGGIYMDTDMILVKPVDSLGPNVLAYQNVKVHNVNGAFMKFEKENAFLYECLKRISATYNGTVWDTAGPVLLTEVWKLYRTSKLPGKPLDVLQESSFYMFHFYDVKARCFNKVSKSDFNKYMNIVNNEAYGVHTNSKITGSEITDDGKLKTGTICKYIFNRYCVLCDEQH